MKIQLQRINKKVHFRATNEDGLSVDIDGSPSIGGENRGMRPMQLVASALAGCSVLDLVGIIEKYRMELDDLQIEVDAERKDEVPAVFSRINLHYVLTGVLEATKVERALELAVKKYCSVGAMLEKSVEITYSYKIKQREDSHG